MWCANVVARVLERKRKREEEGGRKLEMALLQIMQPQLTLAAAAKVASSRRRRPPGTFHRGLGHVDTVAIHPQRTGLIVLSITTCNTSTKMLQRVLFHPR